MAKKSTPNKSHVGALTVLGASVAGIAATSYFFLGPKGKKHQQHAKAWAIKMKGDVVEKLESVKEVSEPMYHELIDAVATGYSKGKKASGKEVAELAQHLKKHWKVVSSTASKAGSDVKKSVRKVKKSVTKKVVKKSTKKRA